MRRVMVLARRFAFIYFGSAVLFGLIYGFYMFFFGA